MCGAVSSEVVAPNETGRTVPRWSALTLSFGSSDELCAAAPAPVCCELSNKARQVLDDQGTPQLLITLALARGRVRGGAHERNETSCVVLFRSQELNRVFSDLERGSGIFALTCT